MTDCIKANLSLKFQSSENLEPDLQVDLTLPSSGVTVIFGPSGSGKTTLLRCLAGLERRVEGNILIKQSTWLSASKSLPTHKRNLGYVPQQPSLFAHLTVEQNLHYGLKRRHPQGSASELTALIDLLGLSSLLNRRPISLSLGEQQRVAIARAVATKPSLLLMDEPLASLDAKNKQEILGYLSQLRSAYSLPIIYVTHSVDEVIALADNLVLMKNGRVTDNGSMVAVFPSLLASINVTDKVFLTGQINQRNDDTARAFIEVGNEKFWLTELYKPDNKHENMALVSVDYTDIVLSTSPLDATNLDNQFTAKVESIDDDDSTLHKQITIRTLGQTLVLPLSSHQQNKLAIAPGDTLHIAIVKANVIV